MPKGSMPKGSMPKGRCQKVDAKRGMPKSRCQKGSMPKSRLPKYREAQKAIKVNPCNKKAMPCARI